MRQALALAGLARQSQRQLPTDLDYAVSTREYQLDQSSPLPASAAADLVLDRNKRPAHLDRSLHIREGYAVIRPQQAFESAFFAFRARSTCLTEVPVRTGCRSVRSPFKPRGELHRNIARTPLARLAWLVSLDDRYGQPRVCSSHVLRFDPAQFYSAVGWGTTATAPGLVLCWILIVSIILIGSPAKA